MGAWLNELVSDQLANLVVGWVSAIPIELHVVGAVGLALVVMRFMGWPGIVFVGMGLAYVLGLKRAGVEIVLPPPVVQDPGAGVAVTKPKKPTFLDKLRLGLAKAAKGKSDGG